MRASNQFADVTTGVVYVHASPAAVCPHVEWALSSTLASKANLKWTGLDLEEGTVRDNVAAGVLEPAMSKVKMIRFATEAAITILRIDDAIKMNSNEKAKGPSHDDY